MVFENKHRMCSFTNCLCVEKHIFKSLCITSWHNWGDLTIEKTSYPFQTKRTKYLTNWNYDGNRPPLLPKHSIIIDLTICLSLLTFFFTSFHPTLNRLCLISHKIFDMFIQYLHFHQHVAFSNIILHQPFLRSSRDIQAL